MSLKLKILLLGFSLCMMVSCHRVSVPRPYGYFRIDIPQAAYHDTCFGPYSFQISDYAILRERREPGERYWADINYPQLNASIHCSYKPVRQNLGVLTADALEFIYKHAGQATSIPEREFSNPDADVYGVLFSLQGNTASPCQFFLTDSTQHFFRAAVYCNSRPNADSLQPVVEYLQHDIEHMIETFQWK